MSRHRSCNLYSNRIQCFHYNICKINFRCFSEKRYEQLIAADKKVSEEIETIGGRETYFQDLLEQAEHYDLFDLLKDSLLVSGNIIELGVWRGVTTKNWCSDEKSGINKKIYACDSFEGFGNHTISKEDTTLFRSAERLKEIHGC